MLCARRDDLAQLSGNIGEFHGRSRVRIRGAKYLGFAGQNSSLRQSEGAQDSGQLVGRHVCRFSVIVIQDAGGESLAGGLKHIDALLDLGQKLLPQPVQSGVQVGLCRVLVHVVWCP